MSPRKNYLAFLTKMKEFNMNHLHRVFLDTAYFTKTENLLLKVL